MKWFEWILIRKSRFFMYIYKKKYLLECWEQKYNSSNIFVYLLRLKVKTFNSQVPSIYLLYYQLYLIGDAVTLPIPTSNIERHLYFKLDSTLSGGRVLKHRPTTRWQHINDFNHIFLYFYIVVKTLTLK